MAEQIEDGGTAFPVLERSGDGSLELSSTGMTLRDYFAAHAPEVPVDFGWMAEEIDAAQRLVRWNWHYADAMLRARGVSHD